MWSPKGDCCSILHDLSCPFDYTAVAGSGKDGPVNQVNHTSWVAVDTPTDRHKSVRNRCVVALFVTLFVLSFRPFDISVGVWAFVIGLSQISSLFSSFHKIFSQFDILYDQLHSEVDFKLALANDEEAFF